MKRRRNMLLYVTATSMAAVVGCKDPVQPVGMVGQPHDRPDATEAATGPDAPNAVDAQAPVAVQHDASTTANVTRDAGVTRVVGRAPIHIPDLLPRVGTTAEVPDMASDIAPSVGTTARAPDVKK